jgi:steroid delta-isomerase-like uncharacterized protein
MGFRIEGNARIQEFIASFLAGMPDFQMQVTNKFSSGDRIASEWVITGTHSRDWPDLPATGGKISIRGASITQVAAGRIVRHTDYYDEQELTRQLNTPNTPE